MATASAPPAQLEVRRLQAMRDSVDHVIHGRDGEIRENKSYGHNALLSCDQR
ncbi:MAG TPA: hypothetical protein VFS40_12640 [Gemmatimonadales bacterium]|nr:hypothetical protein [Gemmatimonadales bacterium]